MSRRFAASPLRRYRTGRAPSAQPNAVGPAGSTLLPGSVDRATLVDQPSVERPNTVENSNSVEDSHSVDRPGPGARTPHAPCPRSGARRHRRSIRRTVRVRSRRWNPPAMGASFGAGRTRQRGRVLSARQPTAPVPRRGRSTSSVGEPACGSAALPARTRCSCRARSSDCPVHSPVPARPRRSDQAPARLPVGTAAPQFISPRAVRESLRPPATTGYLTARRQRWGLGGSHVVPALSTLAATRHARGTGQMVGGQRRRSILGWAIAGTGAAHRPEHRQSPARPWSRAQRDHQRPNRRTRTGAPAMAQPVSGDASVARSRRIAEGRCQVRTVALATNAGEFATPLARRPSAGTRL